MKRNLFLLAIIAILVSTIEAGNWFSNQWTRIKNYSPYRENLPPETAASRIASMRHLYGKQIKPYQTDMVNQYKRRMSEQRDNIQKQAINQSWDRIILSDNPDNLDYYELNAKLKSLKKQIREKLDVAEQINEKIKKMEQQSRHSNFQQHKPSYMKWQHPDKCGVEY